MTLKGKRSIFVQSEGSVLHYNEHSNYPVMILSLCSMLRCLRQRRVSAEPMSRVAPATKAHLCNTGNILPHDRRADMYDACCRKTA